MNGRAKAIGLALIAIAIIGLGYIVVFYWPGTSQ